MDLDVVFAYVIAVLAGAAVIGALVVVLVAEWYALRRVIERHRRQAEQLETFWRNHSAVGIPERRP